MIEVLNDYGWEEAFKYANPEWVTGSERETEKAAPFTREDVVEVIASMPGENDGASWIVLGKLGDGRFFFLSAWCDYTGWGCQEGGRSYVAESRELLERMALDQDDRQRLGLEAA